MNKIEIRVLIHFENGIKLMNLAYAAKLGL